MRFFNFLNKAVFPGRVFTRRMYTKYSHLVDVGSWQGKDHHHVLSNQFKLKQHHHVRIDGEFKADCRVWLNFLQGEDLAQVVNRPMVDLAPYSSASICFYSDASAAEDKGFGCIYKSEWIQAIWVISKPVTRALNIWNFMHCVLGYSHGKNI